MQLVLTTLIAVVLVLGIAFAVQWNWIRPGRVRSVLVFITGVLVILALRTSGVPPQWFDGGKTAFGMVGGFVISALATSRGEARAFGLPLFLGLGIALLAVNLLALV